MSPQTQLFTLWLLLVSSVYCSPPTRAPSALPTFAPTKTPTYAPTSGPTVIPTQIVELHASSIPIALHQLVVVQNGGSELIRMKAFDLTSFNLVYKILSIPLSGSIFQLSQVFSSYGYEPKGGERIQTQGTVVTGSNSRIYYKRPSPDSAGLNKWDSFEYTVTSEAGVTSYPGTVTLVPPSGSIVGSGFLLNNEAWTIEGNKAASYQAAYEPYSRGALLNHYIVGTDDKVNVPSAGASDSSLWYFVAPSKFLGNVGISYGGNLQFSMSSFSGDFSKLNGMNEFVVLLECAECDGPVGGRGGITLGFSLQALRNLPNSDGGMFDGKPMNINIPLKEQELHDRDNTNDIAHGWVKDPQNTLQPWAAASKCDVIQVLSRLSKIQILGDWTKWYETVALDNVRITNLKGQLPICAMSRPDASICTC